MISSNLLIFDYIIFPATNSYGSWLFPYLFRAVPQSDLRGGLSDSHPQYVLWIKLDSQLLHIFQLTWYKNINEIFLWSVQNLVYILHIEHVSVWTSQELRAQEPHVARNSRAGQHRFGTPVQTARLGDAGLGTSPAVWSAPPQRWQAACQPLMKTPDPFLLMNSF